MDRVCMTLALAGIGLIASLWLTGMIKAFVMLSARA